MSLLRRVLGVALPNAFTRNASDGLAELDDDLRFLLHGELAVDPNLDRVSVSVGVARKHAR